MRHIITYRAGAPGYYEDRQRGTIDIWHDQKRYVYRLCSATEVRQFIRNAWQHENVRIIGVYPTYRLEPK